MEQQRLVHRVLAKAFEEEGLSYRKAGLAIIYLQDRVWRRMVQPREYTKPLEYLTDALEASDRGSEESFATLLSHADTITLDVGLFPEQYRRDAAYRRFLTTAAKAIYQRGRATNPLAEQTYDQLVTHYDHGLSVLHRFRTRFTELERAEDKVAVAKADLERARWQLN